MKYSIFLPLLLLSIFSCQKENKKYVESTPKAIDFSKIYLKSEFYKKSSLHEITNFEQNVRSFAWYIGEFKDTLNLLTIPDSMNLKMVNQFNSENLADKQAMKMLLEKMLSDTSQNREDIDLRPNYSFVNDSSKLVLFVDTSRRVAAREELYSYGEFSEPLLFYPVFIQNNEKDSLLIGFGYTQLTLSLFLEAKNKSGEWQPIQEQHVYWCGTGLHDFVLMPNHIAVSGVKIFKGSFKTELRLVYKTAGKGIYSNTFLGNVNEKQFDKK